MEKKNSEITFLYSFRENRIIVQRHCSSDCMNQTTTGHRAGPLKGAALDHHWHELSHARRPNDSRNLRLFIIQQGSSAGTNCSADHKGFYSCSHSLIICSILWCVVIHGIGDGSSTPVTWRLHRQRSTTRRRVSRHVARHSSKAACTKKIKKIKNFKCIWKHQ